MTYSSTFNPTGTRTEPELLAQDLAQYIKNNHSEKIRDFIQDHKSYDHFQLDLGKGLSYSCFLYALECQAWDCLKYFIPREINALIYGKTWLHLAISKTKDEKDSKKIHEVFDLFYQHGANPSRPDLYGTTPYQTAVLLNNQPMIKALQEKGAIQNWPSKLTLENLKDIYNELEKQICIEYCCSLKENKKFLLIIGEEHGHFESKLIEAMAINILHRLKITHYYIERQDIPGKSTPSEFLEKINLGVAEHYKMTLYAIDQKRDFTKSLDDEQHTKNRDQGMINQLISHDSSGIATVGYSHTNISTDERLLKKYKICTITTSYSPNTTTGTGYVTPIAKETEFKAFRPGELSQSKEIVTCLGELLTHETIAAQHEHLTTLNILRTDPILLPKEFNPVCLAFSKKLHQASSEKFLCITDHFCELFKQKAPQRAKLFSCFKAKHLDKVNQFIKDIKKVTCPQDFMQKINDLLDYLDKGHSKRTKEALINCMEKTLLFFAPKNTQPRPLTLVLSQFNH